MKRLGENVRISPCSWTYDQTWSSYHRGLLESFCLYSISKLSWHLRMSQIVNTVVSFDKTKKPFSFNLNSLMGNWHKFGVKLPLNLSAGCTAQHSTEICIFTTVASTTAVTTCTAERMLCVSINHYAYRRGVWFHCFPFLSFSFFFISYLSTFPQSHYFCIWTLLKWDGFIKKLVLSL